MTHEPEPAADDPEIAALLNFPPVVRKNRRHDGWSPAAQKDFIFWLAASGNVDKAAQAVGRTQSGAWTVRRSAGAEAFSRAWEAALDLFHARRRARKLDELAAPPPGPRHTPRRVREQREARAFRNAGDLRGRARDARARGEPVLLASELGEREKAEIIAEIMKRYGAKLRAERQARLEGRITEADFYVRQLSFIELILDIGGRTQELLDAFREAGVPLPEAAATPGSTLLEKARRAVWQEKGEADRPPPAPLGRHNDRYATGEEEYDPARDGDRGEWERKQEEKRRLAAEAQREWEARARQEHPGDASDPIAQREAGNDNDDHPDPAP